MKKNKITEFDKYRLAVNVLTNMLVLSYGATQKDLEWAFRLCDFKKKQLPYAMTLLIKNEKKVRGK